MGGHRSDRADCCRMYFLQQCSRVSDEALEDALYGDVALLAFAGIDLAVKAMSDATTLLKFHRVLVEQELTRRLLDEIGISRMCRRRTPWCVATKSTRLAMRATLTGVGKPEEMQGKPVYGR